MSDDDAVEVESSDDPETDASAAAAGESRDAARTNGTAAATDGEPAESAVGGREEPLADAVAEHDEDLGAEVAALEDELAEARAELLEKDEEIDELTSKLARVRADFSNYKQRAKQKQEDIRKRASESLVERITPVRNDLLRALDQEEGSDLRPGVESTLEKFDDVLAEEGVEPIDPDPGSDIDPARHQVMLRVESDQPDGTVHEVYEPGYEMGDRVVSEAKVTVSADQE